MFEGIAKTNTTNTALDISNPECVFEGIAKTNTTNTYHKVSLLESCLRVLLKQIQQTQEADKERTNRV